MGDFQYKEYTEEESRVYNEAMENIMAALQKGLSFDEACAGLDITDSELKGFIVDDALKVLIADIHYAKKLPLQQVADTFQVSMDIINKANMEMMQDVEIATSEVYMTKHPGGHTGNA
jgi:hypothetical protein